MAACSRSVFMRADGLLVLKSSIFFSNISRVASLAAMVVTYLASLDIGKFNLCLLERGLT